MRRRTKVSLITVGSVAALLLLVVGLAVLVTNTDWGRERVRRQVLSILQGSVNGTVSIGRVSGNLLTGATIADVAITDSAGDPFIVTDTLVARYSLRALLGKRIQLSGVRLVNPLVVLDQPPGGEWNFVRIFASDSTKQDTSSALGWGDWIRLRDVRIANGRVMVRMPWAPDSLLAGAARDSAIDAALGPDGRLNIERVPGGFQTVYDFRRLTATFPVVRVADPAFAAREIQIAALRSEAYPFRPPALDIENLVGTVELNNDSLWFTARELDLPNSMMAGAGSFDLTRGSIAMSLAADTVALADLRWLYPALPSAGGGALRFALDRRGDTARYLARDVRLHVEGATLAGDLGLRFLGDSLGFEHTDLTFASVGTSLVERLAPGLDIPVDGTLTGRAALDGALSRLTVNGDVTFDGAGAGRSRVTADGVVGMIPGGLMADDLRLRLQPVQVALVRSVQPSLPVRGTVRGTATLNGATTGRLVTNLDLVHEDRGAASRVVGTAGVRTTPSLYMDADARLLPLSLATVGRFAPAARLQGSLAGPLQLRGTLGNLTLNADLAVSGGGNLAARGRMDLDGPQPGYDLRVAMRIFDASRITGLAPATGITGTLMARGRGVDPATMRATAALDLQGSSVRTIGLDSATLRLNVADGLARVDTLFVHGPATRLAAAGALGLRADRTGELLFRASIDSLGMLAGELRGQDTTRVPTRPAVLARAVARARADSARLAEATAVERLATGAAPVAIATVDTAPAIRRDSVAGVVFAAGSVRGNLERLDADARLGVQGLVARGSTVRQGRAEIRWVNGLTPSGAIVAAAHVDTVVAAGFALDSVDVRATYQQSQGTVALAINQDHQTDYQLTARYRLALDERELMLDRAALRFDSTTWHTTQPGVVRWSPRGLRVEHVDLTNGPVGRIYVDGLLPSSGPADLELLVREFPIQSITSLLQSDVNAAGLLSLAARLTGTAERPLLEGSVGVANAHYGGRLMPALRAQLRYADETMATKAEALDAINGAVIARVEGTVPLNLALSTTAPRVPDRPMALRLTADSLPLDIIPSFTDAITDAGGAAAAAVLIAGTVKEPQVAGAIGLDRGRMRLAANGVLYTDMGARIRLTRDTVFVDSLLARSGGSVRATGLVGIENVRAPVFDLFLAADRAHVLANDYGDVFADARLAMRGPFDGVYISGTLNVASGVINIPEGTGRQVIAADDPALFAVVDSSAGSETQLLPTRSTLLDNLLVNVNVSVARDTWVRNRDANVELFTPEETGPLQFSLDQRQKQLVLDGVVSTERGEYSFAGRRFQLTQGSVVFIGTPDINPNLQLTGQIPVQLASQAAVNIRVLVGGTLKNPRVTLESDAQPPLSQSDLITYLALGRSSTSLFETQGSSLSSGTSGGGLVGTGAAVVTQQLGAVGLNVLVEQAEGQATRALRADVLNITPAPINFDAVVYGGGPNFSGFIRGTEIEAGKYFNTRTFGSVRVRPSMFAPNPDDRFVPGATVQHRFGTGFVFETSFDGRYLLNEPTLRASDRAKASPVGVFGAFLTKEWRW